MLRAVLYDQLSRFPPGTQGAKAVIEVLQTLSELVLSTSLQNLFHFLIVEFRFRLNNSEFDARVSDVSVCGDGQTTNQGVLVFLRSQGRALRQGLRQHRYRQTMEVVRRATSGNQGC